MKKKNVYMKNIQHLWAPGKCKPKLCESRMAIIMKTKSKQSCQERQGKGIPLLVEINLTQPPGK